MSHWIGQKAPEFSAPALMPDNSINPEFSLADMKGRYVVLFFYPLDFTFVCPTELLELDRKREAFKARGVEIVAASVDSVYSHLAWKGTKVAQGGIGNIHYPLISDITKQISRDYGVLLEKQGVALRATFLIDPQGVIRHAVVNDLPLGRNIDETLRTIDALQYVDRHGQVCPVNWHEGQEAMEPTPQGVARYLAKHAA